MKVSLASINQLWLDKNKNFEECIRNIKQASSTGSELIIFPEMTLTGFAIDDEISEYVDDSVTIEKFKKSSYENRINIIFGASIRKNKSELPQNMLILSGKSGIIEAMYAKTHPFSFANEDKFMQAGNDLSFSKVGDLTIGFLICYDLRFPELCTTLSAKCDVIVVIANWPAKRIHHWKSLLTARAIENQCFFIGVNRIGTDGNNIEYIRSSIAVSPDGNIIEPLYSSSILDTYEIDKGIVDDYRKQFPTIQDKRYDFYAELLKNNY